MFMSGNSNTHPRRKQPQFQYVTEIPNAVGDRCGVLVCSLLTALPLCFTNKHTHTDPDRDEGVRLPIG